MTTKRLGEIALPIAAYIICLLYFFPILYMILTSLKPEAEAVPPSLFFHPTLENYHEVLSRNITPHLINSVIITLSSALLALVAGVPAAYTIVFGRLRKPDSLFFWFLSTTLLPPVSVIIPIFLIFKTLNLLDSLTGLTFIHLGVNIPIVIWMVRSFFKEIPLELLEAADIDGCSRLRSFFTVILPLTRSGITSTALLVFIFVWNEFFFSVNLTYVNASPIPVFMASYMTQEGLFWAKLSAISTITVLPPLILGWLSHKTLVQGLTLGAVKG